MLPMLLRSAPFTTWFMFGMVVKSFRNWFGVTPLPSTTPEPTCPLPVRSVFTVPRALLNRATDPVAICSMPPSARC